VLLWAAKEAEKEAESGRENAEKKVLFAFISSHCFGYLL